MTEKKDIKDKQEETTGKIADEQTSRLEFNASRQFVSWLKEQDISLGFSTYQIGKVVLLGHNDQEQMSVFERTFERPMGMWSDGQILLLSSLYQIIEFHNTLGENEVVDGYDRLYVPRTTYITGDVDLHDLTLAKRGAPIFINSLFSCLATVSKTDSFRPLWKPGFITALQPEDRCHLNGLAMKDGIPAYVSALAESDLAEGWRKHRHKGGIIIDVESNEIVASGLSMPHSPRWYNDKLWVANSGTGEFGSVNLDNGKFEPLLFCPGYIRGVAFHNNFAVLGLSRPRDNKDFNGLALDDRLAKEKISARSGLVIVDLKTGAIVHSIYAEGAVSELYDVVILPGVKRPSMIGFKTDHIRRVLSMEN